jgi:hypothetical protein
MRQNSPTTISHRGCPGIEPGIVGPEGSCVYRSNSYLHPLENLNESK